MKLLKKRKSCSRLNWSSTLYLHTFYVRTEIYFFHNTYRNFALHADYIAQNLTETITIPTVNASISVMTVGGWIVYQQRLNASFNFTLPWNAYRNGFGTIGGNYWLGNENVHQLVSSGVSYKIRFEMMSTLGTWNSAEYYYFMLDSEAKFYTIHVGGYSGDIPNGMDYTAQTRWTHNGMNFTTYDNAHDHWNAGTCSGGNCAVCRGGGWWYNDCYICNLNGNYYTDFSFWYPSGPGVIMQNVSRIMIKPV